MPRVAARFLIRGRVQGVGYRWWTAREAERLGLDGWVRNRQDGTVEVVVAGAASLVAAFEARCREGPGAARVDSVERFAAEEDPWPGFQERATV